MGCISFDETHFDARFSCGGDVKMLGSRPIEDAERHATAYHRRAVPLRLSFDNESIVFILSLFEQSPTQNSPCTIFKCFHQIFTIAVQAVPQVTTFGLSLAQNDVTINSAYSL